MTDTLKQIDEIRDAFDKAFEAKPTQGESSLTQEKYNEQLLHFYDILTFAINHKEEHPNCKKLPGIIEKAEKLANTCEGLLNSQSDQQPTLDQLAEFSKLREEALNEVNNQTNDTKIDFRLIGTTAIFALLVLLTGGAALGGVGMGAAGLTLSNFWLGVGGVCVTAVSGYLCGRTISHKNNIISHSYPKNQVHSTQRQVTLVPGIQVPPLESSSKARAAATSTVSVLDALADPSRSHDDAHNGAGQPTGPDKMRDPDEDSPKQDEPGDSPRQTPTPGDSSNLEATPSQTPSPNGAQDDMHDQDQGASQDYDGDSSMRPG